MRIHTRSTKILALVSTLACTGTTLAQNWVNYSNQTGTRLVAAAALIGADNHEKDFAWGDLDQDGDIDLICVRKFPGSIQGGARNLLLMNEGGVLTDRTAEYGQASDISGYSGLLDATNDRDLEAVDINNDGYFVNDFQLSKVPTTLRELASNKPLTFFLHTPWPKSIPRDSNAIKILKFLATGMLSADVIEFQTRNDLQEFENFVMTHLPLELANVALEVNPVSVDVQALQDQPLCVDGSTQLLANEVSYVHIARSDPIKNTLATISAFTELAKDFKESMPRSYLDLYLVPSRQQWPEYQSLLAQITECVEINNARLSSLNYIPIRLHIGNDYQRASHALTRYDYLIACSVADGLNLVVKEGAILNNRNGVIVSTKNVGAMAELGDFCIIVGEANAMGITEALIKARSLSFESRSKMSFEQKRQIQEFDLSFWAKSVVANFKILEKV